MVPILHTAFMADKVTRPEKLKFLPSAEMRMKKTRLSVKYSPAEVQALHTIINISCLCLS